MNRDELDEKANARKSESEQITGCFRNYPDPHDEGVIDKVAGQAQDALGHVKRRIREAVKSAR